MLTSAGIAIGEAAALVKEKHCNEKGYKAK